MTTCFVQVRLTHFRPEQRNLLPLGWAQVEKPFAPVVELTQSVVEAASSSSLAENDPITSIA